MSDSTVQFTVYIFSSYSNFVWEFFVFTTNFSSLKDITSSISIYNEITYKFKKAINGYDVCERSFVFT